MAKRKVIEITLRFAIKCTAENKLKSYLFTMILLTIWLSQFFRITV